MCHLSACSCYSSCKDCLKIWIEKEETSISTAPTCPFCRLTLADEDTYRILGRSFEPRRPFSLCDGASGNTEEVDDLTQQWLDSHTQSCPSCHSRIQKAFDEDCNLMECLCGYRFCFECGLAECICDMPISEDHGYWDNVLNRYSDRSVPTDVAPVDDETGLVNLKRHIQSRIREEQERRREQRRQTTIAACAPVENDSGKDNEEEFVRFSQVLLKYLERNDPQMHIRAMQVLKFNKKKQKKDQRSRLYAVVGERYWARAQFYFSRLYHQNPGISNHSAAYPTNHSHHPMPVEQQQNAVPLHHNPFVFTGPMQQQPPAPSLLPLPPLMITRPPPVILNSLPAPSLFYNYYVPNPSMAQYHQVNYFRYSNFPKDL